MSVKMSTSLSESVRLWSSGPSLPGSVGLCSLDAAAVTWFLMSGCGPHSARYRRPFFLNDRDVEGNGSGSQEVLDFSETINTEFSQKWSVFPAAVWCHCTASRNQSEQSQRRNGCGSNVQQTERCWLAGLKFDVEVLCILMKYFYLKVLVLIVNGV